MTTPEDEQQQRRSLFGLIGDVPRLVTQQVRGELDLVKAQLKEKLGLLVGALVFAVFALALVLLAIGLALIAAVWALAQVLPTWAAALIVSGILVVLALLLLLMAKVMSTKSKRTRLGSRSDDEAHDAESEDER